MSRAAYRSWLAAVGMGTLWLLALLCIIALGRPSHAQTPTGEFRSGAMDTNESFSFKFDKPGAYRFTCSIHPRMVGTIIVR
jgi:hypothetical protein